MFLHKKTLHVASQAGRTVFPEPNEKIYRGGGMMLTAERTWIGVLRMAFSCDVGRSVRESARPADTAVLPKPADACVDLGAGTGFVATALARWCLQSWRSTCRPRCRGADRAGRQGCTAQCVGRGQRLREFQSPGQRRSRGLQLRAASPVAPRQAVLVARRRNGCARAAGSSSPT